MLLSDLAIRRAKPALKAYHLTDGRGLFLLVTTKGSKSFRYKFRFDGAGKTLVYGQYPDVSLADAREQHAAARKLLAAGINPMTQRKIERATSFRSVALQWLEHWRHGKSERHADTTRRRLERNVFPHLGERPVEAILAPELVAMVKAIEARGVGDLAKRSLETTGQIFRYAIAHGHAQRNPAAEIRPRDVLKPLVKTNLARVDARELPALLRAIETYRGKVLTRLALKMMALTFVRTSELIGARWEEFDIPARRWNIPASRMKMRTPHIVPLATQTLELIELLRTVSGDGEFLFPGEHAGATMSNNTLLFALKRLGYGGRMTGHGFRGLASTLLHEQGHQHEHIELQLAHAPRNSVSAAYNHALYLEPRAVMMQGWADFLETAQRGKLLPFTARA